MAQSLGLMTGPETGTYVQIGKDIARAMAEANVTVDVRPSLGSIDNIKKISTTGENAALGIVQSDVLGFLRRSKNPQSVEIAEKLRLIAPLYAEEIHVLARKNISSMEELAGKRVVVGAEGSGSMLTAVNLFSLLKVKPAKLYKIEPPEAVVAVLTGQADALIFVGGKPVKLFKNMEKLRDIKTGENAGRLDQVHFLPLDQPALLQEYRPAQLKFSDYRFIEEPIPTVALNAVLVGYDFTLKDTNYYQKRCQQMALVGKQLRHAMPEFKRSGHPKWREVELSAPINLWQRDKCAWPAMAKANATQTAASKPLPQTDETVRNLQQDLIKVIQKP